MNAFHRYFLSYLFRARTRQGILFLALAGLFLSSLALMVIQGIMGGLQRGLMARSKSYQGVGVVRFYDVATEASAWAKVAPLEWSVSRELQAEILIRNGGQVAPLVIRGVDQTAFVPEFLQNKELTGLILGADLAQKLKTTFFTDVRLISPATTEALMGEVPRQVVLGVTDYLVSDVSELDSMHGWTRLPVVQNLLRIRGADRWRFYDAREWSEVQKKLHGEESVRFVSWEEQNKTLVWALNLETKVMLALFGAMALLVSLSITTGLFLFFGKIRPDLASFWILGLSVKNIERLVLSFVIRLSGFVCATGVSVGVVFLLVLERYGHSLMPDIFVERNFPIEINLRLVTIAFMVPFLISLVFSFFSFIQFRRDNPSFIQLVRGSGERS
ncbi:MAG: ABC transporter permease [Bacteriovoracia bacterium]